MTPSISFCTAARTMEESEGLRESLRQVFHAEQPIAHELVVEAGADNIFAAYNNAALRAQHEVIAFIHTDVRLLCNHTCFEKPFELVQKPLIFCCGVAGATRLPKSGCWWEAPHTDLRGMVAHPGDNIAGMHVNHWPWGQAAGFGDVVTVDGVLMLTTKKKLKKIGGFDENTYAGWHLYDTDACIRACRLGFRCIVMPIPLLHLSPGRPNEEYRKNLALFVSRFGKHLPLSV